MSLREADTKIWRAMLATAALAFAASPDSAHAYAGPPAVTISTAPTHNMALNNGVYSPTGANPVLNVSDLTNALNAGNLEVATGTHRGDIDIEAAFHWVSGYALTLDAFHSIRVDQPVTDAGTGALTLTTNDGGSNGHLEFGAGGNITFWSLANTLTINGKTYTLVNSIASLAAAVALNASGNYALAASYDASVDHTYKSDPIEPTFLGNFEGLGNAISNVSIRFAPQLSDNVGFFNTIEAGASVYNFRLRNITILETGRYTGNGSGGLAGESDGTLYGDEVGGTIGDSHLNIGGNGQGGMIGTGSGSIAHCLSAVSVKAAPYAGTFVGGLAGVFSGAITDSIATGDVSADDAFSVGGLVGSSEGPISHSHATGTVSGSMLATGVGGLVGSASGPITNSYATGDVTGGKQSNAGGLVGSTSASISRSFATGNVRTSLIVLSGGGLVGAAGNASSITNSYATGAVTGPSIVGNGGFVGYSLTTTSISSSYAAGTVAAEGQFSGGGFICGWSVFANDYWDTTTSGTYGECGNNNVSGVNGLTTTQLQSGLPAGFDPKIWAQDRRINRGFPYLIANPPPQ